MELQMILALVLAGAKLVAEQLDKSGAAAEVVDAGNVVVVGLRLIDRRSRGLPEDPADRATFDQLVASSRVDLAAELERRKAEGG